jgi:hypothetical protein
MLIRKFNSEHRSGKYADDFSFGYNWSVGRHGRGGGFGGMELGFCVNRVQESRVENLQPNQKRKAVQRRFLYV